MNKDEILEKSREEKNDEGLIAAENKGRKIGMIAFTIVFAFTLVFNFFNGNDIYACIAMFWAFFATETYPKYKFTKNKVYLFTTILGATACIIAIATLITKTLG